MSRPGSARLPGFGSSNVAALTDGEMSPEAYSPTQKYALDLKRTMLMKELNQIEGILEKTGGCTRRGCRRLQSSVPRERVKSQVKSSVLQLGLLHRQIPGQKRNSPGGDVPEGHPL